VAPLQALPQWPQLAGSVWKSVQSVGVPVDGHWFGCPLSAQLQLPATQDVPPMHAPAPVPGGVTPLLEAVPPVVPPPVPVLPPAVPVVPPPPLLEAVPPVPVVPPPEGAAQPPQFALSVSVFTQLVPHICSPGPVQLASQLTRIDRDCEGQLPPSPGSGAVVAAVSSTSPGLVHVKVAPDMAGAMVPVPAAAPASLGATTEYVTAAPLGTVETLTSMEAPTTTAVDETESTAMPGHTAVGFITGVTDAPTCTEPVPASASTKPPSPIVQTSVTATGVVCWKATLKGVGALAHGSPAVSVALRVTA
jgi:hypothetical protein